MSDDAPKLVVSSAVTPSCLDQAPTFAELEALCRGAVRHSVDAVAVSPVHVGLCASRLAGSGVRVGTVVSFPLGQATIQTKVWETDAALDQGATEIGYVVNHTELLAGHDGYVVSEMQAVVDACRTRNAVIKVIVETGVMGEAMLRQVCDLATEIGPDLLVTTTSWDPTGTYPNTLHLMRHHLGSGIGIEAAGRVSTAGSARMVMSYGADRLLVPGLTLLDALGGPTV